MKLDGMKYWRVRGFTSGGTGFCQPTSNLRMVVSPAYYSDNVEEADQNFEPKEGVGYA